MAAIFASTALTPLDAAQAQVAARARCVLQVPSLEFGDYDVFDASPTRAATQISIDCVTPRGRPYNPKIELSTGSSQTYAARVQMSGSNRLIYNIYVDPSRTRVAGDGSNGTSALYPEAVEGRDTRTVNLYGAVDPHQLSPPGVYFDTVYVTITF
jgi:spore coat protein U-like protein